MVAESRHSIRVARRPLAIGISRIERSGVTRGGDECRLVRFADEHVEAEARDGFGLGPGSGPDPSSESVSGSGSGSGRAGACRRAARPPPATARGCPRDPSPWVAERPRVARRSSGGGSVRIPAQGERDDAEADQGDHERQHPRRAGHEQRHQPQRRAHARRSATPSPDAKVPGRAADGGCARDPG